METYEMHKQGNKILKIYQDETPESPRKWDNMGTIVCWHSRYILGDDQPKVTSKEWLKEMDEKYGKKIIILPIYMLDHSGLTISINSFHDPWDSGQLGYIYITHEKIKKEYGKLNKETIEKGRKMLLIEVETYDQYLTGDVYGYILIKNIKCKSCGHIEEKQLDSCWGFYGSDFKENGLYESANWDISKDKEVK